MLKAKRDLRLYRKLSCGITDYKSFITVKAGEVINHEYSIKGNNSYKFIINNEIYTCHVTEFIKLNNTNN